MAQCPFYFLDGAFECIFSISILQSTRYLLNMAWLAQWAGLRPIIADLCEAASKGDLDALKAHAAQLDVNEKDQDGCLPICTCVKRDVSSHNNVNLFEQKCRWAGNVLRPLIVYVGCTARISPLKNVLSVLQVDSVALCHLWRAPALCRGAASAGGIAKRQGWGAIPPAAVPSGRLTINAVLFAIGLVTARA